MASKWDDDVAPAPAKAPAKVASKWDDASTEPTPEIKIDEAGTKAFGHPLSRMAASFSSSPDEAIDYYKTKYPKLEFSKAGKLSRLIWKDPSDAKDSGWHYVDPNVGGGLMEHVSDLGEYASDIMPVGLGALGAIGAGALGIPSGPGAIATAVGGAGLGSGLGELANRGIARGLHVNKEMDMSDAKDVAIATALGAAGEGVARAAAPLAKRAISKLPAMFEKIPLLGKDVAAARAVLSPKATLGRILRGVPSVIDTEIRSMKDRAMANKAEAEFRTLFSNPRATAEEMQDLLDRYGITTISEGKPITVNQISGPPIDMGGKKTTGLSDDFANVRKEVKAGTDAVNVNLQQPPNEWIEGVTKKVGFPQAEELRRTNINAVKDTMDSLEDSLIPTNPIVAQVGGLPPKGADKATLEKSLDKMFKDEYAFAKDDLFGDSFDEIADATATVLFGDPERTNLANNIGAVKYGTPEANELVAEIVDSAQKANSLADLINIKRNELGTMFKNSDPNVQRELTIIYNAFNKSIEESAGSPALAEMIKSTNKLYSDFLNIYSKIHDQLNKGQGLAGLDTSSILDKKSIMFLENLAKGKPISHLFEGTTNIYKRVLLKDMKDKLFTEGFTSNDFAKALKKFADNPKEYDYLIDLFKESWKSTGGNYGSFGKEWGSLNALRKMAKAAKAEKGSRLFVPPVLQKGMFEPKDIGGKSAVGDALRSILRLSGASPYVGEALYQPSRFGVRSGAKNLEGKLNDVIGGKK